MSGRSSPGQSHFSHRRGLSAASCLLALLLLLTASTAKGDRGRISFRGRVSLEYDDNIFERRQDRVGSPLIRVYVNTAVRLLRSKKTLALLRYQGGAKQYLTAARHRQDVVGNLVVNDLNLIFERGVLGRISSGVRGRLKGRDILKGKDGSISSEADYLWGGGDLFLKGRIFRGLSGSLLGRYSFLSFEEFEFFNRKGFEISLGLTGRASRQVKGSLRFSSKRLRFDSTVL